jgi:tRNA A37 threonylcarbamoyltransferase TsaD
MKKPYLGLIANSTSTELLLFDGKNYKILGMSIDISLGTAYYLLSKTIDIPLSKFSSLPETEILNYPQPVINHKGLDFSFQGTYYFTLQHIFPKLKELKKTQLHDPCYLLNNESGMNLLANSFQHSIIEQITNKINKAMIWMSQHYPNIKNFVKII